MTPSTHEANAARTFLQSPKFTHCEECGEELPESEIRMGSAYHFACWDRMVRRDREDPRIED